MSQKPSDPAPRLFCLACGYAHFSLFSRPRVPETPSRFFGLVKGTPAMPEHLEAWCINCSRVHVVAIGEYRIVTPLAAPMSEYGSYPVYL